MVDFWRDIWIRETGTGQQVAQLHERYMIMMMIMMIMMIVWHERGDEKCVQDFYGENLKGMYLSER